MPDTVEYIRRSWFKHDFIQKKDIHDAKRVRSSTSGNLGDNESNNKKYVLQNVFNNGGLNLTIKTDHSCHQKTYYISGTLGQLTFIPLPCRAGPGLPFPNSPFRRSPFPSSTSELMQPFPACVMSPFYDAVTPEHTCSVVLNKMTDFI